MTALPRWIPPALVLGTAWAVLPGLGSAFHLPKLAVLGIGTLLAGLASLGTPDPVGSRDPAGAPAALRWAATAWGATALLSSYAGVAPSPEAVLRELCGAVLLLSLLRSGVDRRLVVLAASVAGAGVAAVALLQALGADPFAAAGWVRATPGSRLAVYSTLGNPDFVASWLAPVLVLAVAERAMGGARWLGPAALVMAVALVVTRSFATAGALAAAGITIGVAVPAARRRRALALGVAAVALGVAALAMAAGRDAGRVAAGRRYLLRVAAPHVLDAPLTGSGPGSFEALWPGWEARAFAIGAAGEADRAFAAAQDHVHCDLVERALEEGVPGALAFAAVVGLAIAAAVRGGRRAGDAADAIGGAALAAALAAIAARSLVDFPLARPADVTLFVVLAATTRNRRDAGAPRR